MGDFFCEYTLSQNTYILMWQYEFDGCPIIKLVNYFLFCI